jgi:hypothetical protein
MRWTGANPSRPGVSCHPVLPHAGARPSGEGGGSELHTKHVGELTMAWVSLAKGVDLSPATVGLPGDLCPCPHFGAT